MRTILLIFSVLAALKSIAQPSDQFDITNYRLSLDIPFEHDGWEVSANTLTGKATISVRLTSDQQPSLLTFLLHRLLKAEQVTNSDGEHLDFTQQLVSVLNWETFQLNCIKVEMDQVDLQRDTFSVTLSYNGHLTGYPETGMLYVKESLDPSFTIIRPESFSYPQLMEPIEQSIHNRWRRNDTFNQQVSIALPSAYTAASGYILASKKQEGEQITWHYESTEPSGGMIFPIAKYQTISRPGYHVLYFSDDKMGAERIIEGIQNVFDLYENWLGPLMTQRTFSLIEIPDDYGSQVAMPTIIQTAASYKDPKAMGQLYHEISHFWNARDKEADSPRWNEGQAMYMQYLAYESLNEKGTLISSLEEGLKRAKQYFEKNTEKIAMIDYGKRGVTSSLSYNVGPIFFHVLGEVMGREKLLEALGEFYRQYWEGGVTAKDFAYFMIKNDKRIEIVIDDWYFGTKYIDLIMGSEKLISLVESYSG